MNRSWLLILAVIAIVAAIVLLEQPGRQPELQPGPAVNVTGGPRQLIDPAKVIRVLPPDAIPAIDRPQFTTAKEADGWLFDDDYVIGLSWKGEARAYPYRILNWHEIVNDIVQDDPLLITYCPLCGTGLGFQRTLDGRTLEFGVSGNLYQSELVMYDRQTKSLWTQTRALAVLGELAGARLVPILLDNVPWSAWRQAHPDTKVLSRDTGHLRDYDRNPYFGYDVSTDIVFPVDFIDPRLHPKAIVYGISIGNASTAYPDEALRETPVINDVLAGVPVVAFRDPVTARVRIFKRALDGRTLTFTLRDGTLADQETGTTWSIDGEATTGKHKGGRLELIIHDRVMWFAWAAFHPGTDLYNATA
jgi:hypothetical protein